MINIKTPEEVNKMRRGGRILAKVLQEVAGAVRPGIKTKELEKLANKLIEENNGRPAFKGYRDFPAALCVAINNEIVHGIPGDQRVKQGDLLSLDLGLEYEGMVTDSAVTVPVGEISDQVRHLLDSTRKALAAGVKVVKAGNTLGDVGYAINQVLVNQGYSVIRDLVGHGVGHSVHEEPAVPNFGEKGQGLKMETGMTLALEPMAAVGSPAIVLQPDGWTFRTADDSLAAHFEHTVLVKRDGSEILTKAT